jgi:hypothetical protein
VKGFLMSLLSNIMVHPRKADPVQRRALRGTAEIDAGLDAILDPSPTKGDTELSRMLTQSSISGKTTAECRAESWRSSDADEAANVRDSNRAVRTAPVSLRAWRQISVP